MMCDEYILICMSHYRKHYPLWSIEENHENMLAKVQWILSNWQKSRIPKGVINNEDSSLYDHCKLYCTYLDIVRGTNYLLESLGFDRRICSTSEFASSILIPIYEKICSCKLNGLNRTCFLLLSL